MPIRSKPAATTQVGQERMLVMWWQITRSGCYQNGSLRTLTLPYVADGMSPIPTRTGGAPPPAPPHPNIQGSVSSRMARSASAGSLHFPATSEGCKDPESGKHHSALSLAQRLVHMHAIMQCKYFMELSQGRQAHAEASAEG